jgi:tetratricopeptide (TPR) repeat protein
MTSRRICVLGSLLILAAVAQPAHAEGDPKAAARAHFKRAEAAFNIGKFEEALAAYQAAYETKPLPGFLFNIAQCHRNMGNHERALFFYRRYLALDPQSPNRAVVEELIDETERRRASQAPSTAVTPPPAASAPPAASTPPAPPPAAPPPPPASGLPALAATEPSPPASSQARLPEVPRAAATDSEVPPAFVQAKPAPSADRPLYRRWGFWAVVGAVAAGGAATAILLTRGQGSGSRPTGGLGAIDWR